MPYITQDKRDVLEPAINELTQLVAKMQMDDETVNVEGCLNYVFTTLLQRTYGTRETTNYGLINDAMGLLACVQNEFYRKVAAPYEDQKEFENGELEVPATLVIAEESVVEFTGGDGRHYEAGERKVGSTFPEQDGIW